MWLLNSSIGRKLIMSISGVFLILFLVFHMSMNLAAVFSADAYNMICELLGANWYALAGTAVLAGGFLVHIAYATMLTLQNQKARGDQRYAVSGMPKGVNWASQNMYVLGAIIALGMVMHLAQFWYKMQFAEIMGHHEVLLGTDAAGKMIMASVTDGAAFIRYWFSNPIVCILYLVWLTALWFHLTHGFWSALQTVGWSNQIWFNRWKCISNIFATVIFLGFALVVVVFYLKQFFV